MQYIISQIIYFKANVTLHKKQLNTNPPTNNRSNINHHCPTANDDIRSLLTINHILMILMDKY